jgi:hypothetical protein
MGEPHEQSLAQIPSRPFCLRYSPPLLPHLPCPDERPTQAWLNGEPMVHYEGPTVYQRPRGYPVHGYVYFKTGLYRDELQQPMTIYVDEYRKDELSR